MFVFITTDPASKLNGKIQPAIMAFHAGCYLHLTCLHGVRDTDTIDTIMKVIDFLLCKLSMEIKKDLLKSSTDYFFKNVDMSKQKSNE